jgi:gliding motility-associated-like protein
VFNRKIIGVLGFLFLKVNFGSAQIIDTVQVGQENSRYYVSPNPTLIYNWMVEDGLIISGQGTASIQVNWGEYSGLKQIKVYANPIGSCFSDTSLVYVLVEEKDDVFVPNSFTPNGDGLNDVFKPVLNLATIKSYQILVLNRWGEVIFESNNPNLGWNGQDKNGSVLSGVYLCLINVSKLNNKEVYIKKLITVLN